MQKSSWRSSIIIVILVIALGIIVKETTAYIWDYYTGSIYVVDQYIKRLNEGKYEGIYALLQKSSLSEVGNQEVVTKYYERIYKKENKFREVKKVGYANNEYILSYEFADRKVEGRLKVIKETDGWAICFPFELKTICIKAPNGSKVYLDDEQLFYQNGVGYKKEKVLPGNYMLKVSFAHEAYKDYYQMLKLSKNTNLELPYEVGDLEVACIPGVTIDVEGLEVNNKWGDIQIPELLVGSYEVAFTHPLGYLEPILKTVEIKEGKNNLEVEEFKLSAEGEEQLNQFLENFKVDYKEAIMAHDGTELDNYFVNATQSAQRVLFEAWYVDKKNICDTNVEMEARDVRIEEDGKLHTNVLEVVELSNLEYDEIEEDTVKRVYKVMICWDTIIDIADTTWKITDRHIDESMIAFQDTEGKWIQY